MPIYNGFKTTTTREVYMQRREFFINGLKIVGLTLTAHAIGVAVAPSISHSEERRKRGASVGPELLSVSDPTAKAVGYVENAKKVPAAKGNNCANCQLYSNPQKVNGKAVGACAIFQGKVVLANAYCNSWAKKA